MADRKYDIFISYRRDDGAQYARILQLELEKRGYHIFLDYEELTDGVFGDDIKEAIRQASVFMMVLTPLYLTRSMEQDSWVREEIELAIAEEKHFIPVDPDRSFKGVPDGTPDGIAQIVSNHQHSTIDFGQALGATVDLMVRNRIASHVKPHRRSFRKWTVVALACCLLAVGVGCILWHKNQVAQRQALEQTRQTLMVAQTPWGQYFNWSPDITLEQLQAVSSIIDNMVEVKGGTFMMGAANDVPPEYCMGDCALLERPQSEQTVKTLWMSQYEVSQGQWHRVMGTECNPADSLLPMVNVSYEECKQFVSKLSDLTGLSFAIPTEAEWEYAARGGEESDNTLFAGSDDADDVAWYAKTSGEKAHVCDATNSPLTCNGLDLYDMSGNVSEWCDTDFAPYNQDVSIPNPNSKVIRGGDYASEEFGITVFHREPMDVQQKAETVGLRLVIRNQ